MKGPGLFGLGRGSLCCIELCEFTFDHRAIGPQVCSSDTHLSARFVAVRTPGGVPGPHGFERGTFTFRTALFGVSNL